MALEHINFLGGEFLKFIIPFAKGMLSLHEHNRTVSFFLLYPDHVAQQTLVLSVMP